MARRRFLIDRIPDEALPRLEPRHTPSMNRAFVMLVSLRDCAPYLGTWPPDLDELAAVATRLLLVPGGPLVLSDGVLTRFLPPRPGESAFGHDRLWVSTAQCGGLVGFSCDMVWIPDLPHQPLGRYQRSSLVSRVRREFGKLYWWRTASTFEMVDRYRRELALPMADPMLAGIPAKEDDHEEEMAH